MLTCVSVCDASPALTQLQGIGTSAAILQTDIVACGPSVVHVVNQASLQLAVPAL